VVIDIATNIIILTAITTS